MTQHNATLEPTTLVEALECIVNARASGGNFSFAQSYAKVALKVVNAKDTLPRGSYVQLLYVRNNLAYWRGLHAKAVRAILDNEIKLLEKRLYG